MNDKPSGKTPKAKPAKSSRTVLTRKVVEAPSQLSDDQLGAVTGAGQYRSFY